MATFKLAHLSTGLASATLCLPARGLATAGHHSSCGPTACFPTHAPSLETTMYYTVNTFSPLSGGEHSLAKPVCVSSLPCAKTHKAREVPHYAYAHRCQVLC